MLRSYSEAACVEWVISCQPGTTWGLLLKAWSFLPWVVQNAGASRGALPHVQLCLHFMLLGGFLWHDPHSDNSYQPPCTEWHCWENFCLSSRFGGQHLPVGTTSPFSLCLRFISLNLPLLLLLKALRWSPEAIQEIEWRLKCWSRAANTPQELH